MINKKSYLTLLLCLILLALFAEDKAEKPYPMGYGFLSFNYGYKVNTTQQFTWGITPFITQRLALDVPYVGWSYISNDPFNDTRDNYSVYQVLAPLSLGLIGYGLNEIVDTTYHIYSSIILPALINSTLYYNIPLPVAKEGFFYVAPFIKNETDWFIMRKHDWVQISPGAGLRWQFGGIVGLVLTTGYQRSFQNNFKAIPTYEDMWFFGLSLVGDPSQ